MLVFANKNADVMDIIHDLTQDKVYEVLQVDGETYHVRDDSGKINQYHKSWFYE